MGTECRGMTKKLAETRIWVRIVAVLLLGLLAVVGALAYWSTQQEERMALDQARTSGDQLTHTIMTGITTAMVGGGKPQVEIFLEQIRGTDGAQDARVIPGEPAKAMAGAENVDAALAKADAVEREAVKTGQPVHAVEEHDGHAVYRVIAPLVATHHTLGRDCLVCHQVSEGTVMGVVSVRMSLDELRQANRAFLRHMLIAAAVLAALLLAIVYALCDRTISRPLGAVVSQLREISEGDGDLTKRLDVRNADEIGEVAKWFNVFVENLRGIMAQVRDAASEGAGAAEKLSAAAEQLASGAQEQAASLEETSASLEELTGTVKQNSENADQANRLALAAGDAEGRGQRVVASAVSSMEEITKSARRIADIITTIDAIAFQTNLLALNAAVEAARAGEQGRGFAVVAAEVRNLAQTTAAAAKEIKVLIQDSSGKVATGTDLVAQSGQTLGELIGSMKTITALVSEIAAASRQQSTGLDQVNRAVMQMDTVVQANAGQTHELSATAQAMSLQARDLLGLVGRFTLDVEDGRSAALRGPRVRASRDRIAEEGRLLASVR